MVKMDLKEVHHGLSVK